MAGSALLPLLAAAAGALVAVVAWRSPALRRAAWRNARRRPATTGLILLGLCAGTAVMAASLTAGDSLTFGVRQGAYDALGDVDLFVQMDGAFYFPQDAAEAIADHPRARRVSDGATPLILERAAVSHPAAGQSEPAVLLLGVPPEPGAFGRFTATTGAALTTADIGPGEALLNQRLATRLHAGAGDTVTLRATRPVDPVVPRLHNLTGHLQAAGAAPLPGGAIPGGSPYAHAPGDAYRFDVPVEAHAQRIFAILGWHDPAGAADLDLEAEAPTGARHLNATAGTEAPVLLRLGQDAMAPGNWTFSVHAKRAVDQPFNLLVVVLYEEFDLQALRAFAQEHPELAERVMGRDGGGADAAGGGDGQVVANLTVRAVVRDGGDGDFLLNPNLVLRLDDAQRLLGRRGEVNHLLVSNRGDAVAGATRSDEAARALEAAVADVAAAHPESRALPHLRVDAVKQQWVAAAEEAGETFTDVLTLLGSFTIAAGLMLIVNVFTMLAQERRGELGVARALGLTRRQLVGLSVLEGAVYAAAAAVLGAVVGLGVARGLILVLNSLFGSDTGITIPFRPQGMSLLVAAAAGFLLTLVVVALAAWRTSRLNVVRAIRRLPEPDQPASRRAALAGAVVALAGLLLTAQGARTGSYALLALAPPVALVGAGAAATRWIPRRLAYPAAGGAVLAHALWAALALESPGGDAAFTLAPVRAVILILAATLIVVHGPAVGRATAWLLRRARGLAAVAPIAAAYPRRERLRTGLTVGMFALAILTVALFSTLYASFTPDLEAQMGGYHVRAETPNPVPDLEAWLRGNAGENGSRALEGVAAADLLRWGVLYGGDHVRINGEEVARRGPGYDVLYSHDGGFARRAGFGFDALHPDYPTARAAYEAVLEDPGLVIISAAYNRDADGAPGRFEPGATLTLNASGAATNFTVIGVQEQFVLGGIFVHPDVLDAHFSRVGGDYLIQVAPGHDAREVARELEAAGQGLGLNAVSLEAEAQESLQQARQLFGLFQVYLGLGLVMGVASLGIVTARAALERRREIGVLRAIGYTRALVRRLLVSEVLLTTTLGVLLGVAGGVVMAWGLHRTALSGLGAPFVVPWLDIARFVAVAYAATVAATLLPVRRAGRVAPAEAVRHVE